MYKKDDIEVKNILRKLDKEYGKHIPCFLFYKKEKHPGVIIFYHGFLSGYINYLNVINYYLDHNGTYYCETERTFKVDSRGKTDWSRTIKTQKPLLQGNSPIYLKQVVRVQTPNLNRLITRIHKYCVYESFDIRTLC